MVLPTPPPDDASGANAPAFVARLRLILGLATRGVLVLVEGAPHALGPIVRGLLPEYPNLLVETRAHRLFTADNGQVVVFVPNLDEASSLNFNRPILSQRELKVVLVCDEALAASLAQAAPDFFHWISHRIEGRKGPSPEHVDRLRAAVAAHASPIAWLGTKEQLGATFAQAMPGMSLEFVSAKSTLSELTRLAKPRSKTWVVWTEIEHAYEIDRLRLAWDRAGRGGRNVLMPSQGALAKIEWGADVVAINPAVFELHEAMQRLQEHRVEMSGRLAALTELSVDSVEKLGRLLGSGHSASDLEERLLGTTRPWEVLDQLVGVCSYPDRRAAARAREESDEASLALGLLDHARLLEQQGMFAEAEPLVREGLALYEELFGIDHGLTRDAVRQLTHLLKARGRYGEAILEWLRVLPADATTPGPRHPTNHWLYEQDVKAAQELLFLVTGLRDPALARRAYEAVRAALGDEAKETQALRDWANQLAGGTSGA